MRGTWPGPIVLRQGWAKASARPWNDDIEDAQLRLICGGEGFIRTCADTLTEAGAVGVTTPPLAETGTGLWSRAGFRPWLLLHLYTRDLFREIAEPEQPIAAGSKADWSSAVDIDRAAFPEVWRLGELGLAEAKDATPRSTFLVAHAPDGTVAGFAIVGAGQAVAYLQRVAVAPRYQGEGFGRSLVRASLRWGRGHGGRTMLLNTQPDNDVAAKLYEVEGFERMPSFLEVLRYEARSLT